MDEGDWTAGLHLCEPVSSHRELCAAAGTGIRDGATEAYKMVHVPKPILTKVRLVADFQPSLCARPCAKYIRGILFKFHNVPI